MRIAPLAVFSLALGVSQAVAGEPISVVVVEGVSLPDHLDGFHLRARDAIVKIVEDAGWRSVDAGFLRCREVRCAVDLARVAKATFAVIADGQYREGGYDLRVQIWDGHAMVTNQETCEDCTAPEFVTRMQGMAAQLVEAQKQKFAREALIPVSSPWKPPGVAAAAPDDRTQMKRSYVSPAGWALVAGGLGAAVAGGYLLWADGQLENCVDTTAGTRNCSRERQTRGGLPLVIGGAGIAALGGAVLIYRALTRPTELAVRVGPASLALAGMF